MKKIDLNQAAEEFVFREHPDLD